jgi:hypothetical protein
MENRLIKKSEIIQAEADQQNQEKNRQAFAVGTIAERISALVNLLVSVFRNDWYVDYKQQSFSRDPANPSKVYKIVVKHQHSILIKNTGTGRIRIFDNLWLLPNEIFADENQHYRKFYREIDLLLADNINDTEGYLIINSAGLLTHSCTVLTKQVMSR